LHFVPQSIDQILYFAAEASRAEVLSSPKPGNVGPTQSVKSMDIDDFLAAIEEIQKTWKLLFRKHTSPVTLGKLMIEGVTAMINAQSHGNLLLGHILLFSPLILAANRYIQNKSQSQIDDEWIIFWNYVEHTLENSTTEDAVAFYQAIRLAKPAGLKNPGGIPLETEFDFTLPDLEEKIRQADQTIRKLCYISADFDMISQELLQNYSFCRQQAQYWMNVQKEKPGSLINLPAEIFLHIFARVPDSHIYRKTSQKIALEIMNKARNIEEEGGLETDAGKKRIAVLNYELLQRELNPGTTADLTACIIFILKLFGSFNS
jgi:triphosphoribosyl-dephospho-CoA synthase